MYAARLLKLRQPGWEVRVHERNSPDATFGFGIGLSPVTLARMQEEDGDTFNDLVALGYRLKNWTMRIGSRNTTGGNNQSIGLERASLLRVLSEHAIRAGVRVEWGRFTTLDDVADADLVIAAEGASSPTRSRLAGQLGVTVASGDLAYIWCGADIHLDTMRFEVVESPAGVYVAHVMPYAAGRATFQVDTRLTTVQRSGLLDAPTDADGTNQAALENLSELFAELLGGTPLRGNRSNWSTFATVRCARWSHDNIVLIGDAAHTAHYSVGSGTRMAMEDALILVDTVTRGSDLPASLLDYERRRRPSAERLQDRAVRSQSWWTAFPDRIGLPMSQLMTNYMTRTGALGASDMADADPALFAASLDEIGHDATTANGAEPATRILSTPIELTRVLPTRVLPALVAFDSTRRSRPDVLDEHTAIDVVADVAEVSAARELHPSRVVVATFAPEQEVTPERATALQVAGADLVRLRTMPGHDAVLRCLDRAEQLRLRGVAVAVAGDPADLDLLSAGILAGKLDAVTLGEGVAA